MVTIGLIRLDRAFQWQAQARNFEKDRCRIDPYGSGNSPAATKRTLQKSSLRQHFT